MHRQLTFLGLLLLTDICVFELFLFFSLLPLTLASFRHCSPGFDIICGTRWDIVTISDLFILPIFLFISLITLLIAAYFTIKKKNINNLKKILLAISLLHVLYFASDREEFRLVIWDFFQRLISVGSIFALLWSIVSIILLFQFRKKGKR